MTRHIYLAAPYRGTKEEIEARMKTVAEFSAYLRTLGVFVTTPLFHHYTFQEVDNSSGDYWLDYSESLLTAMALGRGHGHFMEVWIMPLEGFEKSSGIAREIEVASRLGVKIRYVTRTWVVNYDYQWFLTDTPEAIGLTSIPYLLERLG